MSGSLLTCKQKDGDAAFIVVGPEDSESYFAAFDMDDFSSFKTNEQNHYAANIDGRSVKAIAPLYISGNGVDVSIIEVHPDHRGQKLGLDIIRDIFEFASTLGERACVSTQGFTADGKAYLMPYMREIEADYPNVSFAVYPSA